MPTDLIASQVTRLEDLVDGARAYFDVVALGPAALSELGRLLRAPAATVHQPRGLAADAIAQIGGPVATTIMLDALADSTHRDLDPALRQAEDIVANRIAEHLGAVDAPRVRDALLDVLAHHAYPGCIRSLAQLGEARAAPLLARRLADDSVRTEAAEALGRLGIAALPDATRVLVVPVFVAGLEPPRHVDARVAAAAIVATIGGDAAELPLAWALFDGHPAVRRAAALALCARGAAAEIAIEVLIEGLACDSWVERESAAHALSSLGAVARGRLSAALTTLPRDGAVAAVRLLSALGAIEELARLAAHDDRHVRWAAVDALATHAHPDARAALARFAHDTEPAIRERAIANTRGEAR